MDVELNPGPLQKKSTYLLTRLPAVSAISGLVSCKSDKLLSTNYADSRHVGCCGSSAVARGGAGGGAVPPQFFS